MSLFSLKKHSLSLSLFLFLSSICFVLAVDSFFSSSLFVHFFSYWVRSRVLVFSLSFFPSWGDRKPHHPKFVSLSLSLTKRARFGKPDLPLECSAGHKKREG